ASARPPFPRSDRCEAFVLRGVRLRLPRRRDDEHRRCRPVAEGTRDAAHERGLETAAAFVLNMVSILSSFCTEDRPGPGRPHPCEAQVACGFPAVSLSPQMHLLTKKQARRIAVRAQLLDAPRPRHLLQVVERLTLLQVDP